MSDDLTTPKGALVAAWNAVNAVGGTYSAEEEENGFADAHSAAIDDALHEIEQLISAVAAREVVGQIVETRLAAGMPLSPQEVYQRGRHAYRVQRGLPTTYRGRPDEDYRR